MRVAVLSFAHVHAATYIRLLRDRDGIELITADPEAPPDDPTRGRALAEELGAAYADSWDEIFALRPDAVVVTSENARHRHLVERAAATGAHVLCEKPLATTEADAQAMIDACETAGVGLMTAYPVRFSPVFTALRRALADGSLGGLVSVHGANNGSNPARSHPWFADPELSGGGALADHTVHIADLVDALLDGEQAAEVYAQANSILDDGGPTQHVETAGLVTIRYPGGLVAAVDASWSHPPDHPTWGGLAMTCVGEKAIVEFDAFPPLLGGFDSTTGRDRWEAGGTDLDAAMLDEFLDAARTGRRPSPDGASGLRTLRIVLAAYESLRTGQPVTLAVR
ncbi:Gfo/Idh/MocA family protein [Streptomyces sp. NL15-2K]|uniref:Gfo/Idh/MocA family protein n=1 Tax=Streptomyces sp. NL15-2K TaxID=376149 RepID=UPI000F56BC9A|nr:MULTISPECIES: Gfo/Idh/MocA family oxidoreductase [Actinomycetes]WKX10050.1 Gfo/Idh/MocA family oxidoreductase [Kutzneria buriramensis]GCB51662.1 NADH-dependent dyhydrogenase [Streptomyces sp. NL15-2K]